MSCALENNMRVLYVEDEKSLREQYVTFLKRRFDEVYEAPNGKVGLELYKEHSPDIIITDIRMPEMNGLEMVRIIREENAKQKIMVTTAYGEMDYMLDAINLHIDKYILKPFKTSSLESVLNEIKEQLILECEREKYRNYIDTIMDTDPNMVVLKNKGKLQAANRTFLDFTGYKSVEAFKSEHDCICELFEVEEGYFSDKEKDWIEKVMQHLRENHPVEVKIKSRAFSVNANHIHTTDEYVVTLADITLQKQFEQTLLKRIEEEVEKNNRQHEILLQQARQIIMGDMLKAIAHHWRQPLTILSMQVGVTDDFFKGVATEEEAKKSVVAANAKIQELSKMIENFRKFFKSSCEEEEFNVIKSVKRIIAFSQPLIAENFMEIEYVGEETNNRVRSFKHEFHQALLSLITNAAEAIMRQKKNENPGGRIMVDVKPKNDVLQVLVRDNGGGISDEIMAKMFEPYFSTKRTLNNTGLGLFMCKAIVEKHIGGKLTASNTEDGAEFVIEFPARCVMNC